MWPNLRLKVLTKNIFENLDQTSASILWLKFKFQISTKPQFQNHAQTVVNTFLSINISNTNNIKKFWVDIFKDQSHTNQVYYIKTAVSESVSDLGPKKRDTVNFLSSLLRKMNPIVWMKMDENASQ